MKIKNRAMLGLAAGLTFGIFYQLLGVFVYKGDFMEKPFAITMLVLTVPGILVSYLVPSVVSNLVTPLLYGLLGLGLGYLNELLKNKNFFFRLFITILMIIFVYLTMLLLIFSSGRYL